MFVDVFVIFSISQADNLVSFGRIHHFIFLFAFLYDSAIRLPFVPFKKLSLIFKRCLFLDNLSLSLTLSLSVSIKRDSYHLPPSLSLSQTHSISHVNSLSHITSHM
jgi:hypothetical protein